VLDPCPKERVFVDGIHPKVVQEMLGHSTIAITLDIYSHLMPTIQEEAADKMGDFLRAG